ncbi:MAG: DUF1491 family protein [Emcibacter sp.]|nr:DUF1491 family protein [Emcibacter sp.]
MFDEGIKTSFWVFAEIKRCDSLFLPTAILHKGDADRGLVLIKQYIAGKGCILHSRKRNIEGKLQWSHPLGSSAVIEKIADDYIARELSYDEDLWIMEVEDPKGNYIPLA